MKICDFVKVNPGFSWWRDNRLCHHDAHPLPGHSRARHRGALGDRDPKLLEARDTLARQ